MVSSVEDVAVCSHFAGFIARSLTSCLVRLPQRHEQHAHIEDDDAPDELHAGVVALALSAAVEHVAELVHGLVRALPRHGAVSLHESAQKRYDGEHHNERDEHVVASDSDLARRTRIEVWGQFV